MNISFSLHPDNNSILAIYITISDGEVYRTVPISEGECYADEDVNGNFLGIEVLA